MAEGLRFVGIRQCKVSGAVHFAVISDRKMIEVLHSALTSECKMTKVLCFTQISECDVPKAPRSARTHVCKISAAPQFTMITKCKINQVTVLCLAGPPAREITTELRSTHLRWWGRCWNIQNAQTWHVFWGRCFSALAPGPKLQFQKTVKTLL